MGIGSVGLLLLSGEDSAWLFQNGGDQLLFRCNGSNSELIRERNPQRELNKKLKKATLDRRVFKKADKTME